MVDYDKHVSDGWRVADFIKLLLIHFNSVQSGKSTTPPFKKGEDRRLIAWCIENQRHHQALIPDVYEYFKKRLI